MTNKKQIDKFREIAKELECDESEKAFDEKLGKLTKNTARPKDDMPKGCG